jgi:hypothetical protein
LAITLEAGRGPDQTYAPTPHAQPGSLRISDWGHFHVEVFAQIDQDQAFFLSRLNTQMAVRPGEHTIFILGDERSS